ncbi:hypothetical protein AB4144_66580, partial [Rhizobiaceae sp. 2RAB30]
RDAVKEISPRDQTFIGACFALLVGELEEAGIDPVHVAKGLSKAASEHAGKVVRAEEVSR